MVTLLYIVSILVIILGIFMLFDGLVESDNEIIIGGIILIISFSFVFSITYILDTPSGKDIPIINKFVKEYCDDWDISRNNIQCYINTEKIYFRLECTENNCYITDKDIMEKLKSYNKKSEETVVEKIKTITKIDTVYIDNPCKSGW